LGRRLPAPDEAQGWVCVRLDDRDWTWATRQPTPPEKFNPTGGVKMRIMGIDLAVRSVHKAVVVDEGGHYLTRVIEFHKDIRDLAQLLGSARQGDPNCELWVVMEPTGMAWFPIAAYFARQPGIRLYLVNTQQVADLRRFYKRHAKSDRIDARLLARLPLINGEQLHELVLPSAVVLACQRSCKQLDRLEGEITALKNRILAADRFAWPGLE